MSLLNVDLSRFIWMNDQNVYCYDVYKMCYWLRDSWDIEKKDISIFYAIDKKESFLILSMSSMQFKRIWINMIARTWFFNVNEHAFELFFTQAFAKALQDESTVYTLVMINVVEESIIEYQVKTMNNAISCITNALETQTLLVELKEYEDVFSTKNANKLFLHEEHDHAIEITAESSYESLYNLLNTELMILRQYLNDVLVKEWIKHFISLTDTFILFILKKNDSLHLCINYQDLNKITVKNHHSLSLISETLDRLSKVKQFTKLNLKNVYHHFRIQCEDEWKTTFCTRYNHFKYMIMSFDLINASVIFQTYINKILTKLLNNFCVVYLNDILIFFVEKIDHVDYVKQILKRLRKFKLYASLKKCEFFITKVNFLKFIIFIKSVSMNSSRINIIKTWFRSKMYWKIQVFLKFVNFYRHFIHHYSQIAKSLTKLLRDSVKDVKMSSFIWLNEAKQAFNQLRDVFMRAFILRHFDSEQHIHIEINAFNYAVASILSQLNDEDQWYLIAFWFRMMIDIERNYEIHDQKLLVIVVMFKHWRHYVKNSYHTVEVLTDHNNLKSFMNIQELNKRQVRWIMRLLICNFEIAHRSEKTRSINVSSRWSDYKSENISANHLLLILQRKLTRIESLNSFIFVVIKELYCIQVINNVEKTFVHSISMNRYSAEHAESRLQDETHWWIWVINDVEKTFVHNVSERRYSAKHVEDRSQDEIYCTWVINEVEKMSVHNVSENTSTSSAMHVRSMLLRVMTLAMQKMHLNEVHFLRNRISRSEFENLRRHDDETSTHRDCNVAEKQLNFVAETVDCKQLISHAIVKVLTIHEMIYNFSNKFIVKLIKILQQENEFAMRLKADEIMSIQKSDVEAWTLNSQEMIEYNESLYVSEDFSVREKLLKRHHDNLLARHFDADKISKLLNCKYYWKSMIKNVKEYINTCDICQRVKMKHHLSYDELRSLSQFTDSWKEITMNFITDLSSSKWKEVMYDLILVIVNYYMKMMHYLFTKKILTVIKLAKLFFKKIALKYEILNNIIINKDSLFINVFWSKICYHVKMKRRLSIAFHSQTDDQTE